MDMTSGFVLGARKNANKHTLVGDNVSNEVRLPYQHTVPYNREKVNGEPEKSGHQVGGRQVGVVEVKEIDVQSVVHGIV